MADQIRPCRATDIDEETTAMEYPDADRREQQLLGEFVQLMDVTHGAMGGHDRLGAGYSCAGCQLRERARALTAPHATQERPGAPTAVDEPDGGASPRQEQPREDP